MPDNIKKVYIYGGTAVISEKLERELTNKGIKVVERFAGENRYETGLLATSLTKTDRVILARGTSTNPKSPEFPDAVAASGLALKKNANIVLTDPNKPNALVKDFVQKQKKHFVLGGPVAISNSVIKSYGLTNEKDVDTTEAHFIDVEQGNSTLFLLPNGKNVLIDGGLKSEGDKVVSYLNDLGIDKIDLMIATQLDEEHLGGLLTVLDEISVKRFMNYSGTYNGYDSELIDELRRLDDDLYYEIAKEGNSITIDSSVDIQILNTRDSDSSNMDDSSTVLNVTYGETDFLLMSDATKKVEDKMIEKYDIDAEILQVGQHGANTATSSAFLNEVKPELSIISYGENSNGLPSNDVIKRLEKVNSQIKSTKNHGDIKIVTDGVNYTVKTSKN
ncbi:cell wall-binding repeat-containing protein [Bacillus carboniphilus]|uniref:Cell wall-binding repeat-containing protein n=1 Tax=Bacillus carboniphilus TaxID=86663 RepID=A0ABY9JV51_9BACI|nr:cell wall-binding repeat-containing protein [Bacillus carboniphilus]WLR41525.1 cell wall-binding repeat-containing protein [Bacillus carboniphilus]